MTLTVQRNGCRLLTLCVCCFLHVLQEKAAKRLNMGPLKMAAMNGLSMSRASVLEVPNTESSAPRDERVSEAIFAATTHLDPCSCVAATLEIQEKRTKNEIDTLAVFEVFRILVFATVLLKKGGSCHAEKRM